MVVVVFLKSSLEINWKYPLFATAFNEPLEPSGKVKKTDAILKLPAMLPGLKDSSLYEGV
jgi:hypothetical protein